MLDELRELYQELILDHGRRPRHRRELRSANRRAEGFNPVCGDQVTVFVELEGEVVRDVSFTGVGCSISVAAASMMTEAVRGKPRAEVEALVERFRELITGRGGSLSAEGGPSAVGGPPLGKLEVFAGVAEFPVRVKCAALAWHTLKAALAGDTAPVSTEAPEPASGAPGQRSP